MKTPQQIEEESSIWRSKNFPSNTTPFFDSHEQLIGMTEEIGELWATENKENQADALGDLVIYMMGYCQRRGWSLASIVRTEDGFGEGLIPALGRLSHCELKKAQNIRLNENHDHNAHIAIADIWAAADRWAIQYLHQPLIDIVNVTWEQVGKRDWIADPVGGGQDA